MSIYFRFHKIDLKKINNLISNIQWPLVKKVRGNGMYYRLDLILQKRNPKENLIK